MQRARTSIRWPTGYWHAPWNTTNQACCFSLACEHLHAEKIVRPGVTRIERLVMEARERGHRETFRRLGIFFTEEQLVQLDQLLVRREELDRTPLA